jgi:hypothetical protein
MSAHTPLVVGAFTRKIRGVPQARPIGRSTAALSCKFAVALQGDITQHVGMEAQPGLGQDGFDFGYGGVGMLHTHSCIPQNSSALNAFQVGALLQARFRVQYRTLQKVSRFGPALQAFWRLFGLGLPKAQSSSTIRVLQAHHEGTVRPTDEMCSRRIRSSCCPRAIASKVRRVLGCHQHKWSIGD